ncbi:hypothetical protein CNR22_22195 [Sphingobacteriaceae bacterium]|nr:hypothetical protein CNR22_22195 [Sphingobacteriaceae bacterium]
MDTELLNGIEKASADLITLLSSLSDEQLNKVPFKGSWTAGQVGDHVFKFYGIGDVINGTVKDTDRDPGEKIPMLKETFLNFEIKMKSPDFILPVETFIHTEDLIKSIKEKVEQVKGMIQTLDLTKTCLDFTVPGETAFTGLEWLYFILFHTQRHLHQLKNIIKYL